MIKNNRINNTIFLDSNLPALFQSADKTSIRSQNIYLLFVGLKLGLILFITLLTILPIENIMYKKFIYCMIIISIFTTIIISLLLYSKNYEKKWHVSRTIAELIKALSWKYMTITSPFSEEGDIDVNKKFTNEVKKIMDKKSPLFSCFTDNLGKQISNEMIKIRRLPFNERLQTYIKLRLKEQRNWYTKQSNCNKKKENLFFIVSILSQSLTFLLALITFWHFDFRSIIGLLTTFTACIVAWMQIKKYQELTQSYAHVAQELGFIMEADTNTVSNDKKLDQFVTKTEELMFREHSMWLTRRE